MANEKTGAKGTSLSPAEAKKIYEERLKRFEAANDPINLLRDVTKATTLNSVVQQTKDQLRTALQNPTANEKTLRSISRYLYYRSHAYFRIVKFFANQFDLNARSIIPNYDLTKDNDQSKILKSFYNTSILVNKLGLQEEIIKELIVAFREDVAYACVYFDEKNGGLFLMPLDPDYCKIDGYFSDGGFAFSFDMSYWNKRKDIIEFMGEPWKSMWDKFNADTRNNRWQRLPEENMFCLKFRSEDYDMVVPPFTGIFNGALSLIGLEDIQSTQDEQQVYKMVYLPMKTISGSNEPDDWVISPGLMLAYYNKYVSDAIPENYVSSGIIPGDELKMLDFSDDAATDVDRVSQATQTLIDTAGGGELLMGSNINSTAAFNAAMKANTEFAISTLLPQIQRWVNRMVRLYVKNPAKVKFFEISIYTRDDFRKNLIEGAQYGLPTALAVNTLNGFSETETMALNYIEQTCLDISKKFIPLNSSYTASPGAPQKDDSELTDDGDKSRNR